MTRSTGGAWTVGVYRELETLLADWNARADRDNAVGILHLGFDRPPSREFDAIAARFPGRMLVTGSARHGLPSGFRCSPAPVGQVGSLPIHLATLGWGYVAEETEAVGVETKATSPGFSDWLSAFAGKFPEDCGALVQASIFGDSDYIAREVHLERKLRQKTGIFRFETLIGSERSDPCAFARASPPWLAERAFSSMSLSVRASNVFITAGISKVGDLDSLTPSVLLTFPNFGRKSIDDLLMSMEEALQAGPFTVEALIDHAGEVPLLAGIQRSLLKYSERERDIILRRMGLDGNSETLQQIGDDYGLTRERVRQIEAKAVQRLIQEEFWDDLLSRKLRVLLQSREFPLPVLGVEAADPWFAGIAQFGDALRYALSCICNGVVSIVAIDGVDYFAFMDQDEWQSTLNQAKRLLVAGVDKHWSQDHCRSLVYGLLSGASQEFRSLLWDKASALCHFSDDGHGVRILTTYGRGAEQIVEAVLNDSDHPLHYSEIATAASAKAGREIDVRRAHNAASEVGMLMGRRIYGLDKHLPFSSEAMGDLADAAEDIVVAGPSMRQWHASELLSALRERGAAGTESVLSQASGPMELGEIVRRVETRIQRTCERTSVSGCLQALEAVMDQEGHWSLATSDDVSSEDEFEEVA